MQDAFYKKQLEEWGIEQVRLVNGDPDKKRQEEQREISLAITKSLMETPEGRRWLFSKLDMCMTTGSVFVPGKPDLTNFFLGAQWVGQHLLNEIMQVSPEKYYIMIEEESARKNLRSQKTQAVL